MRIERVDDKTVKCYLSNEELEEYDIDYKDFILRSEKAKEIVQEIMEQAEEEVGYKPPKFAFDLQIMMLPDQGLVLTFSEKEPTDFKEGEQILECLKDMKQILQRAKETAHGQQANKPNIEQKAENPNAGQKQVAGKQNPKVPARPEEVVFAFDKLGDLMEFAMALPGNLRVSSALYRMNDFYYLYLQKGSAAYERYSRACVQALEFGRLYAAEADKLLHIQEHGECLITEGALKKLRM